MIQGLLTSFTSSSARRCWARNRAQAFSVARNRRRRRVQFDSTVSAARGTRQTFPNVDGACCSSRTSLLGGCCTPVTASTFGQLSEEPSFAPQTGCSRRRNVRGSRARCAAGILACLAPPAPASARQHAQVPDLGPGCRRVVEFCRRRTPQQHQGHVSMRPSARFNVFSIVFGVAYMGLFSGISAITRRCSGYTRCCARFSREDLVARSRRPGNPLVPLALGAAVISLVVAFVVCRARRAERLARVVDMGMPAVLVCLCDPRCTSGAGFYPESLETWFQNLCCSAGLRPSPRCSPLKGLRYSFEPSL